MGKGIKIGVSHLYYALITEDANGDESYVAPVRLNGVNQINISMNSTIETFFAENAPYDVADAIGEVEIELTLADLTLEEQIVLLGQEKAGAVYLTKGSHNAPYIALGFKTLKSNGKYRFVWLTKGKMSVPDMNQTTKAGTVEFQPSVITGKFVQRNLDEVIMKKADEDTSDYLATIGDTWFDAVESADTVAPTVTVVPNDGATGVAVDADVVATFSEAIIRSAVTNANFFLIKDSDGSNIAGTLSIDSAREVVTFNPTSNLESATAYTFIITTNVTDLFGNNMESPAFINFTTA